MDTELERDLRAHLNTLEWAAPPSTGLADRLIDATRAGVEHRGTGLAVSRTSSRIWVSVVAAVVTGVLLLGVAWARMAHDSSTGHPTPSASPPPRISKSNQVLATEYVNDLLARAVTLPGSTRVDRAPVPAVEYPFESTGTENLVERKRWWTAPGTLGAAIAYFEAHPPPGLTVSATASTGPGITSGLSFAPSTKTPTDAFTSLGLMITVAPTSTGVAVLADAQASWLPERTAAETIPADATSVEVTLRRRDQSLVGHRTLTGPQLQHLASLVNSQRVTLVVPCFGLEGSNLAGRLVFHTPGRADIQVDPGTAGCAIVGVTVGGRSQPALVGGTVLYEAILAALGLPPHDYGR